MIAALVSVVMVSVWVGYIAMTVLAITGGDAARLIVWVIATPLVGLFELGGIHVLERTAKFG